MLVECRLAIDEHRDRLLYQMQYNLILSAPIHSGRHRAEAIDADLEPLREHQSEHMERRRQTADVRQLGIAAESAEASRRTSRGIH